MNADTYGRCCATSKIGLSNALRHAWAPAALRGGTDIKSLQDAGGWTSPAMPLRYVESQTIANEGITLG